MIVPLLITGAILGGIAAFAPRVAAPITPAPPTPNPNGVPTGTGMGDLPVDRQIRIDPDFMGTIRARVGNTIQMHGVSRRSDDDAGGYTFTPGVAFSERVFNLPVGPNREPLVREEGPNEFRLIAPGRFEIRWAPNYVVTVEVQP